MVSFLCDKSQMHAHMVRRRAGTHTRDAHDTCARHVDMVARADRHYARPRFCPQLRPAQARNPAHPPSRCTKHPPPQPAYSSVLATPPTPTSQLHRYMSSVLDWLRPETPNPRHPRSVSRWVTRPETGPPVSGRPSRPMTPSGSGTSRDARRLLKPSRPVSTCADLCRLAGRPKSGF